MQAYASAQLVSLEPVFRHASAQAVARAGGGDGHRDVTTRSDATASPSAILASLILDGLDEDGLADLARRLQPHLQSADRHPDQGHVAYTVASLASELGVSAKAIRCAIARRELSAVKRGSRWIISAEAVSAWATASETRRGSRRPSCLTTPRAAGPSLRSVLCGSTSRGGAA